MAFRDDLVLIFLFCGFVLLNDLYNGFPMWFFIYHTELSLDLPSLLTFYWRDVPTKAELRFFIQGLLNISSNNRNYYNSGWRVFYEQYIMLDIGWTQK